MERTAFVVITFVAVVILAPLPAHAQGGGFADDPVPAGRIPGNQTERIRFTSEDGCLRVAAAGVVTRNAPPAPPETFGRIMLGPEVTDENIVWAGLYWEILADEPPGIPTLNGGEISAIPLPVTKTPCWPHIKAAHAYFAEVTHLVRPGENLVEHLEDSAGSPDYGTESEGASLVVVYRSESTGACEIIVMDGNNLLDENADEITETIAIGEPCADVPSADLIFIGADGQAGGDDNQTWNGLALGDGNDFDCSDPVMPGAFHGGWDTDQWSVEVVAPNSPGIMRLPGFFDCVSWIATVLVVGPGDCQVPTPVESRSWGGVRAMYR